MDYKKELMMIKELMDKLVSEMEPSADDFEERLGRKKPDVEVLKVKGVMPGKPKMEEPGMDMDDMEMSDEDMDMDHEAMMGAMSEEDESPDEKLKKRLMKLRS